MAIRCFGLMLALVRCLITVSIALLLHVAPAAAVLNSDSYDGNIYALYAGNGSLVPPASTLEESLAEGRTAVIVYYLDDSAVANALLRWCRNCNGFGAAASICCRSPPIRCRAVKRWEPVIQPPIGLELFRRWW